MLKRERESGVLKTSGSYSCVVKLQPWFLSLRWTAFGQNCSLGAWVCNERPALGQNTLRYIYIYTYIYIYAQLKYDTGPGRGVECDEALTLKNLWIARLQADHACRTIAWADVIKRWDEHGKMVGWNFWKGKTVEIRKKNLLKLRFVHHETHMK